MLDHILSRVEPKANICAISHAIIQVPSTSRPSQIKSCLSRTTGFQIQQPGYRLIKHKICNTVRCWKLSPLQIYRYPACIILEQLTDQPAPKRSKKLKKNKNRNMPQSLAVQCLGCSSAISRFGTSRYFAILASSCLS